MPKRVRVAKEQSFDETAQAGTLRQIIAELSDGVIIVSHRGSILWANRCALDLHGVSDVEQLGKTVAGFRRNFELRHLNKRRLEASQYPLDRLLEGELFRDIVVEVSKTGSDFSAILRLRGLSIAEGRTEHLVLIINDETERVRAEQRFERMFNANPAPAAILRLHDLRYVRINTGFAEMTGYHVEDVIGRSVYEIDVLEGAARRELAIERLKAGHTIPQMEALLQLPRGGEKCVIVAGQPIEVGDTDCMLFTFADLDGRRQAEASLRQSEARFETAFRLTPVPTLIAARNGMRVLLVNDALLHATGFRRHDVVGTDSAKLLWEEAEGSELEQRLQSDGHVHGYAMSLKTAAGHLRRMSVSAEAVTIRDQACALVVAMDVSSREKTRAEIARAIGAAMRDTHWFVDAVLERMATADTGTSADQTARPSLPPRAQAIVDLVCGGSSDAEVAAQLGLSRSTVRNHLSSVYKRLGLKGRAELMAWHKENTANPAS